MVFFQMLGDGCLPNGWQDTSAIKDIQRDVCTNAVCALQPRPIQPLAYEQACHTADAPTSTATTTAQLATQTPLNPRDEFNKETG